MYTIERAKKTERLGNITRATKETCYSNEARKRWQFKWVVRVRWSWEIILCIWTIALDVLLCFRLYCTFIYSTYTHTPVRTLVLQYWELGQHVAHTCELHVRCTMQNYTKTRSSLALSARNILYGIVSFIFLLFSEK